MPETAQPHSAEHGGGAAPGSPDSSGFPFPADNIGRADAPGSPSRRDCGRPGPSFNLHAYFDAVLDEDDASQLWARALHGDEASQATAGRLAWDAALHSSQLVPNVPLPLLVAEVLAEVATRPLPAPLAGVIATALRGACYSRAAAIAASHGAPRAACRVLQVHSAWLAA